MRSRLLTLDDDYDDNDEYRDLGSTYVILHVNQERHVKNNIQQEGNSYHQ
jgi:hypothetical protein